MRRLLLLPLFLTACYRGERADDVVEAIVEADRALIADRPDAVAEKYAKMAESPFTFLRGNLALYERDFARRTDLAERFSPRLIRLMGDPHPENLGTFGSASGVVAEWSDFDVALEGVAAKDVVRAASSLAVFTRTTCGIDEAAAVDAFAVAYDSESPGDGGLIVTDLLAKAMTKGVKRDELDGVENLRFVRDDEHVEPNPSRRAEIVSSLPLYAPTRAGSAAPLGAIRDVVQRLGKGVASLPLERYFVLVAGTDAGGSEDAVLEVKEAWDSRRVLDAEGNPTNETIGSRPEVADRIVGGARMLGSTPWLDPDLGVLYLADKAFVVRSASAFHKGIDFDDVSEACASGEYAAADLAALGAYLGGQLAVAHRRGGAMTTDVDRELILDEAQTWADRTIEDHALFVRELEARGPLLGAE